MKRESELSLARFLSGLKRDGVNLAHLARTAKIPRSTLNAWASGQTPLDLSAVRRLAKATKRSVHFILFGEEDNEAAPIPDERLLAEVFSGRFEVDLKLRRVLDGKRGGT